MNATEQQKALKKLAEKYKEASKLEPSFGSFVLGLQHLAHTGEYSVTTIGSTVVSHAKRYTEPLRLDREETADQKAEKQKARSEFVAALRETLNSGASYKDIINTLAVI